MPIGPAPSRLRPARLIGLPRTLLALGLGLGSFLAPQARGSDLSAQTLEGRTVPKGQFEFMVRGIQTSADRIWGPDGSEPLGEAFGKARLTPQRFSLLQASEGALRTLLDDPSALLHGGSVVHRLEINDQEVPLRLSYGVFSRMSFGVTVPVVRRRVESRLNIDGTEANVGMNPAQHGSQAAVNAFRVGAEAGLASLVSRVESVCGESGSASALCMEGQAARARLEQFLGALNSAWAGTGLFPLSGSSAGDGLQRRWDGALDDLVRWGSEGPAQIPLATRLGDEAFLRDALSADGWDASGFPFQTPKTPYALGDVELHLSFGLTPPRTGQRESGSVQSSIQMTARIGTGPADSLMWMAPLSTPRGFSGARLGWVSDLDLGSRNRWLNGLRVELGWETFLERSLIFRAADPEDPWQTGARSRTGSGAPGDRIRLVVAPHASVTPGLEIRAGWEAMSDRGSQWRFDTPVFGAGSETAGGATGLTGSGVQDTGSLPAHTHHHLFGELHFDGARALRSAGSPLPLEVVVRGGRTLWGTEGAPAETRISLGARLTR